MADAQGPAESAYGNSRAQREKEIRLSIAEWRAELERHPPFLGIRSESGLEVQTKGLDENALCGRLASPLQGYLSGDLEDFAALVAYLGSDAISAQRELQVHVREMLETTFDAKWKTELEPFDVPEPVIKQKWESLIAGLVRAESYDYEEYFWLRETDPVAAEEKWVDLWGLWPSPNGAPSRWQRMTGCEAPRDSPASVATRGTASQCSACKQELPVERATRKQALAKLANGRLASARSTWLDETLGEYSDSDLATHEGPAFNTIKRWRRGTRSNRDRYVRAKIQHGLTKLGINCSLKEVPL